MQKPQYRSYDDWLHRPFFHYGVAVWLFPVEYWWVQWKVWGTLYALIVCWSSSWKYFVYPMTLSNVAQNTITHLFAPTSSLASTLLTIVLSAECNSCRFLQAWTPDADQSIVTFETGFATCAEGRSSKQFKVRLFDRHVCEEIIRREKNQRSVSLWHQSLIYATGGCLQLMFIVYWLWEIIYSYCQFAIHKAHYSKWFCLFHELYYRYVSTHSFYLRWFLGAVSSQLS